MLTATTGTKNLPKESHKELQIFLKYFEEEWMIKVSR